MKASLVLTLFACLLIGCASEIKPPATPVSRINHAAPMPYFRGHPMFVSPPYAIGEPRPDDGF